MPCLFHENPSTSIYLAYAMITFNFSLEARFINSLYDFGTTAGCLFQGKVTGGGIIPSPLNGEKMYTPKTFLEGFALYSPSLFVCIWPKPLKIYDILPGTQGLK